MQRFLGFVLDKFSELGPVRKLFKFLFGRLFDNLIDREIKLSDFKNNILELENLPLSAIKINKAYLSDSPYKLKEGKIGKLKIKIASFKELASKDIEVQIDKIHLVFAFDTNYHKQKNFQMGQNNNPPEPEIQDIELKDEDEEEDECQNQNGQQKQGKQDMFKQFIRQVLSNIKLSVNDLVIDLYMSKDEVEKQPYLMLRLKKLKIYQQKKDDIYKKLKVQKDRSENLYWIKLKEISAFIIKPNEKQSKLAEFPFSYPNINDVQCIFTTSFKMKQFRQAIQSQDKKEFDKLNQSYLFDFTKSMVEKDIRNQNFDDESFLPNHFQIETLFNPNEATVKSVKIYIPPVEIQLDPIQLKVLQNFSDQFSSYSKMRKINEYKRNNFCQIEIPMYNAVNRQRKKNISENKKQEEEDFENLQQQKSVIVTNDCHFQIGQEEQNQRMQEENKQRESPEKKQDLQNINLNNSSSQNEEYDLMNQIQFDFYNTQFDFKIYAINIYLLKKHIKVDENKRILPSKQDGDNEENDNYLYLRNWIYYYDEINERVLYPKDQIAKQTNRFQLGKAQNQQSIQGISQIFLDKTSYNDSIPCSYFFFQLKAFKIITQSPTKKVVSVKSIKLIDVNLINNSGIFSEIKQNNVNPSQTISQIDNSKMNIQQLSKISQIQNLDQSQLDDIFQSALGQFGQSQIQKQSYRESINQSNSQVFKSIINDQSADDELFYSMQDNQQSTLLQSNRASKILEEIKEEVQEIKKQELDLKPWQISKQNQHYCISYILLIKNQKKSNSQAKSSNFSANNISRVQYKQDILFNQNWLSDENQKNELPLAFQMELIKRGSIIDGQANIGSMYTSFDLRILRDFYQIMYPCDDWAKFTEKYKAYDNRLQKTENITLLDQYAKQCEQIEKFISLNTQNQKKQKEGEANQQDEAYQIEFSLNIQKFKFVYFSYQEKSDFKQALKKYDLNNISSLICVNNTTCFCSNLMKDARNNKKYLAENLAVQFNNINFTYQKSNQQNSNNISLNMEKTVVGLLKINKDLCLESTEPIFKFNNLLDIESVQLNLILLNSQSINQQGSSLFQNSLNLTIGSLQINIWNLDKILNLVEQSQGLFQDYQNLLQKLQKFDRELCRSSKVLTEKYSQNDEDKSEDGQGQDLEYNEGLALQFNSEFIYEQDQEISNFLSQFYIQLHINKLDLRIIYLKNYKNYLENIKNNNLAGSNDYNKGNLLSHILKNSTDKKYTPFKYQLIPQNFCIQLIFRHNFINIDRGQNFSLKMYEIYLVDHLQSKINLGNYKQNQNGEDLTYNQLIQISSDSKEIENKLLIYSASYYDPRVIEEEQNSWINKLNVIDLDKNEKIQRDSLNNDQNKRPSQSFVQGQDARDQSKAQPVIYLKLSYKVEQENRKIKSDPNPNNLKSQDQNSNNLNESVFSEDGDQEAIKDNVMKITKNKIIFSSIAIQDFIIRFGDFRSEIIQNFLDIANIFGNRTQIQSKENTLQNQVNKIVQSQDIQNDKFPKQFQQINQNETIMQVEIGNMFINNIAIDLFPFHDEDIRQKLPKVYQNVAESNQKSGFFTNQRSIVLLRNIIIKKLKYKQVNTNVTYASQNAFVISQNIYYDTKKDQQNNFEFQLEVKGLDFYTLIFDDLKKYLNPIVLCRQNFIFKDIQSLESRIHLDNKQYDFVNQLEQLGFQNIVEIECFLHLQQSQEIFSANLQIEKLYINSCKDSIISFPLHITLISLLFQRLTEPLTKQQNIDLSDSQNMKDQSSNLNNSMKKSQKQQNQIENKNQNLVNSNNQPRKNNDSFDFEVFGEEFQIEEDQNTQFQTNAKDQDIEYFHKQNLDDQIPITYFDFSINKLEIQIFSGQDFSFEPKQKTVTPVRKRLQNRDTKQNLLLTFYKLRALYSQYSTVKKINLCIHGIELQGTVANQAQQIIQKKDNKQKMILLDITIDELKRLISLRTYLARIKLIIDKVHKQLFEDLSQVHIDLEQISVNKSQIKPEHSEAILFNNISKIQQSQNEQDQEIPLQNEINLDNQKEDEDIDDDYEIYNGDQNEFDNGDTQQYKLSLIQICPIEIEITVNWFVNSILKDSLLIFNQYFNSKEKGIAFNEDLVFCLQNHYTKIFDVHIMKNSQILQIMKDVVLIRNITNITKNLANVFILPYKSFKNNGKIATGLIEGVKGFQQSIFTETKNLLSVVSNIYSQYIKYNIMKITKIKKLLKNKKQK
ncbi:hypothetical protein TTHERM_00136400 (macronuclear) [Tetrahymena thermophila SB210]|uniref:Chorein N-terminal domain-containing protein n=1 Tax=Tetrahymena thermophila (strain SB210) TaxID=312017 RepID=I7M276_TETTS|nr:hypothetical protein TTHERM_00136400 [Tetrahymena thermophila SB210]EAR99476.3 hypothetical protein TTHERM_00136400 [Tetrahymena thermophila SB210]|eukprot:XP_001019721.3 hypothetical protein TTHERM_00136400 [Tetrahymena thermophila SB210]